MIDGIVAFASFVGKLIDVICSLPPFSARRRKSEPKIVQAATTPKAIEVKKADRELDIV
jgi:hypothetical protein